MIEEERTVTIVTPTGCIGNRGIHRETFAKVLDQYEVDCIAVDAGSLDPGPWYLGSGKEHSPQHFIEWDIETLLEACIPRKIPIIIGTAGGNGARPHVDSALRTIRAISERLNLHFKMAVIYADIDKGYLQDKLRNGETITPVGHDTELTQEAIDASSTLVGMMGVEPILSALDAGVDVVLAGRAADNAVIAAFPIRKGFDPGLALHMGDILECGESAAIELRPVLRGLQNNRIPMIGQIFRDHFLLTPGHEALAVTPQSAIAHSFYERASIYKSTQPNGVLDKTKSVYEAVGPRTTKVSGTELVPSGAYSVLVEGVRPSGFRSISILGIRTPRMVQQIDSIIEEITVANTNHYSQYGDVLIHMHVYGKNAVLQTSEWNTQASHELGLVIDVVASNQELAHEVCLDCRMRVCWTRYDGRQTTAGNAAVLFSPAVIDVGQVYEFSVHHAVSESDPTALFTSQIVQL